jgi:hypothetical protein
MHVPMAAHANARLSRRKFLSTGATLGAAVAAGILSSCSSTSSSKASQVPTTVTTQLEYIFDVTFAGWYQADARGYFRQEGIYSSLIPYGSSISSIAAVVASGKRTSEPPRFRRCLKQISRAATSLSSARNTRIRQAD